MCEIVVFDNNETPNNDVINYISNMCQLNTDGYGIITPKGIRKDMNYKNILDMCKYNNKFILHARTRTSGKVNITNCQPIPAGNNRFLMHHGSIDARDPKGNYSDTFILASMLLMHTNSDAIYFLECFAQYGNRFVLAHIKNENLSYKMIGKFNKLHLSQQTIYTSKYKENYYGYSGV